jgi:WXXGXW repeat (2 copies)
MIDRRKVMFASLAGVLVPICAVLAQPGPDERRDAHPDDHDRPHPPEGRPAMPPPRHEERGHPPGPEASYHWRDGHWNWDGHRWVWIAGVWFR